MAYPLYVAFLWHHHHPLYTALPDKALGHPISQLRQFAGQQYALFTRLWQSYPQLPQTVNWSPCLLEQLSRLGRGGSWEPSMALALTSAAELTPTQKRQILTTTFALDPDCWIAPYPKFLTLYEQYQSLGIEHCLANWTPQDYGNVLAWQNLVGFDPLTVAEDRELQQWIFRTSNFTLPDRQRILTRQRDAICKLLATQQILCQQGQVEMMTSPYHHGLLPLLLDSETLRHEQPDVSWPDPLFCWTEDGDRQLQLGKQAYRHWFGREPLGIWPPELLVNHRVVEHFSRWGLQWFCGDETLLSQALPQPLYRDPEGKLLNPTWLYRPYRITTTVGEIIGVFRDQRLSESFEQRYCHLETEQAVAEFLRELLTLREKLPQETPWLVTISLPSENVWQTYPQRGYGFLNTLFAESERLVNQGCLQWTTVSNFLSQFPQTQAPLTLNHHTGINLDPWLGNPLKNQAWDALIDARQTLANHPEATEVNNPEAWQSLYAAENSVCFKSFQENPDTSARTAVACFQQHLIRLYKALNESVPAMLYHPLLPTEPSASLSYLYPNLEQLDNLLPWQGASQPLLNSETQKASGIERCYYGQNPDWLYVRLDSQQSLAVLPADELHLWWYFPQIPHPQAKVAIAYLPDTPPLNYYFHHHAIVHWHTAESYHETASNLINWNRSPHGVQCIQSDKTLVIAIPKAAIKQWRQPKLAMIAVLAHQGEFVAALSEDSLWHW